MRYYSLARPVSIGTIPSGIKPIKIINFDEKKYLKEIECEVWGYFDIDELLDSKTLSQYEIDLHERILARNDFKTLKKYLDDYSEKRDTIVDIEEMCNDLKGFNFFEGETFDFNFLDLAATISVQGDIVMLNADVEYWSTYDYVYNFRFKEYLFARLKK